MQALPFLAAGGSLVKGVGGFLAGNANAKRQEAQAEEESRATEGEIRRLKDEQRAEIGNQLAAQSANGIEGGSGTALTSLRQSMVNAALDVMELRRQGVLKARALRTAAKDSRREGKFALLEGVLGAGSSIYKQGNDWAQERRRDGGRKGGKKGG